MLFIEWSKALSLIENKNGLSNYAIKLSPYENGGIRINNKDRTFAIDKAISDAQTYLPVSRSCQYYTLYDFEALVDAEKAGVATNPYIFRSVKFKQT